MVTTNSPTTGAKVAKEIEVKKVDTERKKVRIRIQNVIFTFWEKYGELQFTKTSKKQTLDRNALWVPDCLFNRAVGIFYGIARDRF